jgi:hypothetical protein
MVDAKSRLRSKPFNERNRLSTTADPQKNATDPLLVWIARGNQHRICVQLALRALNAPIRINQPKADRVPRRVSLLSRFCMPISIVICRHYRLWRKCFWDHSSNRAAPVAHICPCDGQHVRGNGNFLVPVRQLATLKTSFLVLRDARSFVGGCDLLFCRLFAIKSVYGS